MSERSEHLSREIRKESLKMVSAAKASHIGGALSMADLLAVLYEDILNLNPSNVNDKDRDRFLLSKGHACTGLYAVLALKEFFPMDELKNYSANDGLLLSHTSHKVNGVELSTGSLGHALPVSCGIALAAKRKNKSFRIYCLLSDGELDEGSNWEAILFAPQHKLYNLTVIIDYNKIQSFGSVKEVLDLHPLNKKFEAFNWNVIEINGHDHDEITGAFMKASEHKEMPTVIIAHTIKGKGVSIMENELLWHYRPPSEQQLAEAIKEIDS
ncbi:MAG TPA: transketolase [Ignavibacteria bacterium]|nr:transketolase [Ignavibacteria bacterium]